MPAVVLTSNRRGCFSGPIRVAEWIRWDFRSGELPSVGSVMVVWSGFV